MTHTSKLFAAIALFAMTLGLASHVAWPTPARAFTPAADVATSAASVTAMPRVVISARRMSQAEKNAYDAMHG